MRPIRVMVAEDDRAVREALQAVLQSDPDLEFVGSVSSPQGAVEAGQRLSPDVVVVDVKMENGGGERLTRELRTAVPATRVIAYSAYKDRSTVVRMLRAGACGYLVKGGPIAELVQAIRDAVEGKSALSGEVAADVIEELTGMVDRFEGAGERLRQLDRTKNQFISILSHELMTPVTVLNGVVATVLRHGEDLDNERTGKLLASAEKAIGRMRRIVADLATVARLDDADATATARPVLLRPILEAAVKGFPGTQIECSFDGEAGCGAVWGDAELLLRAFTAVLDNAVAFTPQDGPVRIVCSTEDDDVLVRVIDEGPGLPADAERLFAPFEQADTADTRSHPGLGLGLYLTRRIVESMGGTLTAEPCERGTTLVFRLRSSPRIGLGLDL